MRPTLTLETSFQIGRAGHRARKQVKAAPLTPSKVYEQGRIPRITRLMALAIRFDKLIRDGVIRDYAEIARLGHVTRARATQIMNLLLLSPSIQEEILFLPKVLRGRDPIVIRHMQPLAALADWQHQDVKWRHLKHAAGL